MSYQFKGTNIENIIDTEYTPYYTSSFNDVYTGLPKSSYPNYNNSRLLSTLGFSYTDPNNEAEYKLKDNASAKHDKFLNDAEGVYKPTNANQFRYFIIGGSGGGGGGGGVANNSGVQGDGGNGGNGGHGKTSTGTYYNLASINYLDISIGNGGRGGNHGNTSSNNNSGVWAIAGGGGNGGTGTPTTIKCYSSNGLLGTTLEAKGGEGGGGGGGGQSMWSFWNSNKRNAGGPGANKTQESEAGEWNPHYVTTQSGGGGGGGGVNKSSTGNPGAPGQSGYAVIVWLYD